MALSSPPPPSLQEATKNSTLDWQENLESLFHHAKDRFPDVVWELDDQEVWGHKAIVYARAPPSFQNRYFARSNESTTALPYPEEYPAESTLSLNIENSDTLAAPTPQPTLLRLTTEISPTLFSNELEYLYTGKGFGEAFEFLFDSSDTRDHSHSSTDEEALRIDKLRKDLVFMWRSRLYSDVRIALTGNFGATGHEATTAIFSSHRFVLVSRSSYFHTALIAWPNTRQDPNEPPTLTLPSPPFTPASVHFTLGFLYTGTLIFSHRSYDLSTGFAILRSALYLNLTTLHDEIQARIAQEMLHGLFHAFLSFPEYEALTQGRWGTGGCRCRQCARRVPRVLAFAVEQDVHNSLLERGARRAMVGMFGEGWATQEFSQLQPKLRESILKGVAKRTTPENALPLLFAAEHALRKLGNSIEPWSDIVRENIITARNKIDEVVTKEAEAVFATDEWEAVVEGGGMRFEDGERVEWAMASVLRGVREEWAPVLYQTLVASILLRTHPTEPNEPLLAATSHIRVQVEQTRVELLKWLGKHWLNVRQARGFDPLEGWSLKEISDHIEVPIDDLLSPPSYSSPAKRTPAHLRPASAHPYTSKADVASEAASSIRVSVLSRVAGSSRAGPSSSHHTQQSVHGGRTPSVHSLARSTASSVSTRSAATVSTVSAAPRQRATEGGMSPARRIVAEARMSMKERPDSKFADDDAALSAGIRAPSIVEPEPEDDGEYGAARTGDEREDADTTPEPSERDDVSDNDNRAPTLQTPPLRIKKTLITRASLASVSNIKNNREGIRTRTSSAASLSPSISPSVRARTTTGTPAARRPVAPGTTSTTTTPPRPGSRGSTTSTLARTRLVSKPGASTATTSATSPRPPRTPSTASFASSLSRPTSRVSTRSVSGGAGAARPTSSASAAESFRTASAGSGAGSGVSPGGAASSVGTRSRRTSAASTMSTLSRHTTTTTTTTTGSTASTAGTAASGAARRAPRVSGGARSAAGSPADERTRRISGASVSSVASARSTPATRATPVRKAASAGPARGEKHLSPAAAVAAAAKARPGAKVGTPRRIGTSASAGAATRESKAEKSDIDASASDAGDETVVLAAPPVPGAESAEEDKMEVEEEDKTVRIPLGATVADTDAKAEKENMTPSPKAPVPVPIKDTTATPPAASIPLPLGVHVSPLKEPAALATPEEPSPAKTSSTITVRPSAAIVRADTDHKKSSSSASSSSVATLRRKGSNDTIRTVKSSALSTTSGGSDKVRQPLKPAAQIQPSQQQQQRTPSPKHALSRELGSIDNILAQDVPQGATLEIGIPCIISSKRKRFKAYARYIGEVLGERGPWVGVEVPMPLGDGAWGDDAQRPTDDRPWHDGSWGGVRYFEIGGGVGGSEWEYAGEDRAARRRRVDGGSVAGIWGMQGRSGSGSTGIKREGDQLSIASDRMKRMRSVSPAQSDMSGTESRGLFVRPQQVLYVVDAVGSDL